ncbi:MAG: hypothetical protein RL514_3496 [Verrucomicrobiota bacterium]|jgi:predicted nucleic acid-binding protein
MNYLDASALIRAWRKDTAPKGVTRSHSVAEFYRSLTGGITVPVKGTLTRVQFSPEVASAGAQSTFAAVSFADLDGGESLAAVKLAAAANIQGANIHDWMHATVAEREGCKAIVTTNQKHFKEASKLPLLDPSAAF